MNNSLGLMAVCCVLAWAAAGCGDDSRPRDTGVIVLPEAGTDGYVPPVDAPGTDAPVVTGCRVGIACTPDRGCPSGECEPEYNFSYGGAEDPITGHPDGMDTTIPGAYFVGGYCTPSPLALESNPAACDRLDETSCGDCAQCEAIGQQMGEYLVMCFRSCSPSITEQTCAQPTQECILSSDFCFDGCTSDDECAIYRPDTNMNGEIDYYDAAMNPMGDHLVYDAAGDWTCNMTTRHCEHPGVSTATAGDPCAKSSDCEHNGRCLTEAGTEGSFPGGYCLKDGCLVAGNGCANDGVCIERRVGFDACLGPCNFAQEPMADRLGAGGHGQGCRSEYTCMWDGVGTAGTPNNGGCFPGNYNAITTANTGAACTDDADCYSPYGAGMCFNSAYWLTSHYCSLLDCGAPGMPTDICGANAQCLTFYDDITFCAANCTTASDCSPGYGCVQWGADDPSKICFPICAVAEDCRTGQTCIIPMGETYGSCG